MAYATLEQLAEHLDPDPAPANSQRLLDRASRDVDSELLCAVYDVDASGMPTKQEHIDALREATLEQVSWRLSQGDDDGLPSGYQSVSIGSVTLSRGSGATGGVVRLGDQARQILASAGLTGQEPWTW